MEHWAKIGLSKAIFNHLRIFDLILSGLYAYLKQNECFTFKSVE